MLPRFGHGLIGQSLAGDINAPNVHHIFPPSSCLTLACKTNTTWRERENLPMV
jgi:hypothetical protein